MCIIDAVLKILLTEHRPMRAGELAKQIVDSGLWNPETKTPVESVGAALYSDINSDIKKNGARSKFAKAGNGYFALSEDVRKEEDNAGFVYILTHRCFKDGIVKIGRTKGEVEKRNLELFSVVKKFDINGPRSTWPEAFDWLCKTAIKFKRLDEKFGLG